MGPGVKLLNNPVVLINDAINLIAHLAIKQFGLEPPESLKQGIDRWKYYVKNIILSTDTILKEYYYDFSENTGDGNIKRVDSDFIKEYGYDDEYSTVHIIQLLSHLNTELILNGKSPVNVHELDEQLHYEIGTNSNIYDSKIHILSTLKLKGIDADLIHSIISADDLNRIYKIISPPETPDPPHLARKNNDNRRRKVEAINYMLQQIKSDCICNHVNLAKVASMHNNEWNDTPDKTLSSAQLKELSMLIVPPERRYASNQHTKKYKYDPSACKCELPNHKPSLLSVKKL